MNLRRGLPLRALALFAAMFLSLPAWAGELQYLCRHSGRVMDSCCCKAREKAAQPTSGSPEVKAARCCDTLRRATMSTAPVVRDSAQLASCLPPESTLTLVAEAVPGVTGRYDAPSSDRVRDGPAIFLRDCRLLT